MPPPLEERTKAVELYIQSGCNEGAVIRTLGYPSVRIPIANFCSAPTAFVFGYHDLLVDPVL